MLLWGDPEKVPSGLETAVGIPKWLFRQCPHVPIFGSAYFLFFFVRFRFVLIFVFQQKKQIPCAAHRPPHRKKRNTVTVNAKMIVTASKKKH